MYHFAISYSSMCEIVLGRNMQVSDQHELVALPRESGRVMTQMIRQLRQLVGVENFPFGVTGISPNKHKTLSPSHIALVKGRARKLVSYSVYGAVAGQ